MGEGRLGPMGVEHGVFVGGDLWRRFDDWAVVREVLYGFYLPAQ